MVFETDEGKIKKFDLEMSKGSEEETPPEDSRVFVTNNKPTKEKQFYDFLISIKDFIHFLTTNVVEGENYNILVQALEKLKSEMSTKRDEYFVRFLSLKPRTEELYVAVSHFRFGFDTDKKELQSEFINFSLEKLKSVCQDYFNIDFEQLLEQEKLISEKRNAESEQPELSLDEEKLTSNDQKDNKDETGLMDKIKNIKNKFKRKIIKLLVELGATTMSVAELVIYPVKKLAELLMAVLSVLKPEFIRAKSLKSFLNKNRLSQKPGASGFKFKSKQPLFTLGVESPAFFRGRSRFNMNGVYVSLEEYAKYNSGDDSFESDPSFGEESNLKKYTDVERDAKHEGLIHNIESSRTLLHFSIGEVDVHELANPNTKMMCLPQLWKRDRESTFFAPLYLKANYFDKQKNKIQEVELSLFHDERGFLYFDTKQIPEEVKKVNLKLTYATVDLRKEETPIHLAWFLKNKTSYIYSRHNLTTDVEARTLDLSNVPELSAQIQEWKKITNIDELIHSIEDYFGRYSYAKNFIDRIRIKSQSGKTDLEKIILAESGNCFDVNRLVYVVLQMLDIPVRLSSGYNFGGGAEHDYKKEKHSFTGRIPNVDKISIGKSVGLEGDVGWDESKSSIEYNFPLGQEPHAFLTYYNKDEDRWKVLDTTPKKSRKDIKYTEAAQKKSDESLLELEVLDRENGRKSLDELIVQARKLWALEQEYCVPWQHLHSHNTEMRSNSIEIDGKKPVIKSEYASSFLSKILEVLSNIQFVFQYKKGVKKEKYLHDYLYYRDDYEKFLSSLESFYPQAIKKLRLFFNPLLTGVEQKIPTKIKPDMRPAYPAPYIVDDGVNLDAREVYIKKLVTSLVSQYLPIPLAYTRPEPEGRGEKLDFHEKNFPYNGGADTKEDLEKRLDVWLENNKPILERITRVVAEWNYKQGEKQLKKMVMKELLGVDSDEEAKEIEEGGMEDTVIRWRRGEINGTVVERNGKKYIELVNPDSGKHFFVINKKEED
ncbi:MAG: transglutaminase domain-containing protein [Candidatus Magasanikiibacteriota bacterium]